MPFNIENFKAQGPVFGGARPSLFEIIISDWPGSNANAEQQLRIMAKASQIPPSVIGQVEIPYFGRRIKVMGDRQYANWNVTIINDEDYNLRETFELWHQQMNRHIENVTEVVDSRPSTYKRDGVVRHFGKDGQLIKTYTVKGIFPTQIDAMSLDWEMIDQITMFDVEFSVDYFLPNDDTGQDSSDFVPEGVRNIATAIGGA